MVHWDKLVYLRRAAIIYEWPINISCIRSHCSLFCVDLRFYSTIQLRGEIPVWKLKYSGECYITFEWSGTDWDSPALESAVAINLQWHWSYRSLKLHHQVWSISSSLILLDWIGDIIPLLTGRQRRKPGVTGRWGTECSCWWLWRGFLSLTAEKGIYMSCYIYFYPPSLWQIYHTLIFLACRVLSNLWL